MEAKFETEIGEGGEGGGDQDVEETLQRCCSLQGIGTMVVDLSRISDSSDVIPAYQPIPMMGSDE